MGANLLGLSVNFGPFSFEIFTTGVPIVDTALAVIVFAVALAAAIDGTTFAFRGIRDAITISRGATQPSVVTRFACTIAALFLFFSGGAVIVGLAAWVSGTSSLKSLIRPAKKKTEVSE